MTSVATNAVLAVLAGGEGSRMGRPKGELRVDGRPILEFLLKRLAWPRQTLLVTAPGRTNPPGCEAFDCEVSDAVSGQGPLRGVLTALENCGDADAVIVATCDMPLVTRQMLDHIESVLSADPDALGAMWRRGDGIEPFPMALRPAAIEVLSARLSSQQRSLHSLAKLQSFRLVHPPAAWSPEVWTNLNSPLDYQRFLDAIT